MGVTHGSVTVAAERMQDKRYHAFGHIAMQQFTEMNTPMLSTVAFFMIVCACQACASVSWVCQYSSVLSLHLK
jgi:hypothetical protein